jgi:flavin-dependent dehydrogenase
MAFSLLLERHSLEKLIIIGGGIAGLTCMNELLNLGHSPLLLEDKTIGQPKVCGEFLAPLASLQLQKWDIGPIETIKTVHFQLNHKVFHLELPEHAGAFSRSEAELGLAKRAEHQGGRIQQHSRIEKIVPPTRPHSPYTIHMASGEQIQTMAVIMATGKFKSQASPQPFPYQGFKIHFPQVIKPSTLLMAHYKGAYFGIVPISAQVSNLTCLAQNRVIEPFGSCKAFFHHLSTTNPLLQDIDFSSVQWLEGKAPEFKLQRVPDWHNAWFIGDALASFYPALGYGFAHSIHSAMSAAQFFHCSDVTGYKKYMQNEMKWKLRLGKLLHHCFMNHASSHTLLSLSQKSPVLTRFFMQKAGYPF